MKSNHITIIMLCFGLAFSACNAKQKEPKIKQSKTEASNEEKAEADENSVELTDVQIRTVGITLGTIEMKELTATIRANGVLRVPNNNKGNATSLYGGVIKAINVQIGSRVSKGQVIAIVENPQFIMLQEEYLTTVSKIVLAEQELHRQQELNNGNAGAKKNLQSASSEMNLLKTRRSSLINQLQLMGISPGAINNGNLKATLFVRSPINGTVSDVFAKIGAYVDASSPVAEIVDNASLHLDLQVFEKDLPKVKVGQTIHFTLTNNPVTEYDATIFSIGSSFENDSKTIAVHCKVKANKGGLIDGMNITGLVSLSNVKSTSVPNDAIVDADGKTYIFVLKEAKGEHSKHKEEEAHQTFERLEVIRGVSDMGYTAISLIKEIPLKSKIITQGAYFVNAKMIELGGHDH